MRARACRAAILAKHAKTAGTADKPANGAAKPAAPPAATAPKPSVATGAGTGAGAGAGEDAADDSNPIYGISTSGPPPDVRKTDTVLDAPPPAFDMFDVEQLEVTEEEKGTVKVSAKGSDDRREVANALVARNRKNMDDWDDVDGYYKATIGELVLDRYKILAVRGRGVFSTVVFCRDTKPQPTREGVMPPTVVAIKLIRNNDTMRRTAVKEIELLQALGHADKHGRHHIVRMYNSFEFRNHTCMVFEAMHMDLSEVRRQHVLHRVQQHIPTDRFLNVCGRCWRSLEPGLAFESTLCVSTPSSC